MSGLLLVLACVGRSGALPEAGWDREHVDQVHVDMVRALLEVGSCDRALDAILSAKEQGYGGRTMDLLQAEALLCKDLPRDALTLLQDESKRDPERNRLVCIAHADLGQLEAALTACRASVRQLKNGSPRRRAEAWQNLGFVQAASLDHEHAVESYQQALLIDPSYTRARNNLAFSLAMLGHDDEALRNFKSALEPTYGFSAELLEANAHYNLGLALVGRGDRDAARRNFTTTLSLVPEHEQARSALAELRMNEEPE